MKTRSSHGLRVSLAALLAAGCAGPPAASPGGAAGPDLAGHYRAALDLEVEDATSAAPYLDLLDEAVQNPGAPGALPAGLAALDALVLGATPGLEAAGHTSIAYRSAAGMGDVATRLRAAWEKAAASDADAGPILRGSIATALHELALHQGDEAAAATWGARRGCAQAATVIGPVDWTPLRALAGPSPIRADAPLAASYPGIAPFAAKLTPAPIRADTCLLDVDATSYLQGTRVIVADLEVPRAERIRLGLTSSSAAIVEVGGAVVIRRGYDLGGRPALRFGAVDVPEGKVRVVVRVAEKGDGTRIELDAWGDDGLPLRATAPRPGDVAAGAGTRPAAVEVGASAGAGPAGGVLAAAGLLATGEVRAAEHLLEPRPDAPGGRPFEVELLYARAVEQADDLPENKATERLRGAIDKVLAERPGSWEGRIGHARATERRRGAGDGVVEALRELGSVPATAAEMKPVAETKAPPAAGPPLAASRPPGRMELAYAAMTARRAQMIDLAEKAYRDLEAAAPGAPLVGGVDARLHGRVGADAVAAACAGPVSRAEETCYDAHRERGDYRAALGELLRLRRLRAAPEAFREQEIWLRIQSGDAAGALAVYDALSPGERRMSDALGYAAGRGQAGEVRPRLDRDALTAHDSPFAIAALTRQLGLDPDPAPALEAEGRKLVTADRAQAFLPGAGTAVLRHVERYAIRADGLVRYVAYDLRRVSGTTDVAQGGTSYGPSIEGRGYPRLLRRTIHKKDGRVLEPDTAANAQQSAADLSQLEAGDYVEQILEGWSLPGDTGQLVIDTPDLLPERTSVREASIEVRRDAAIPLAVWAHPLLGRAEERTEGATRVSTWRLTNAPPRRIEDGIPKMERGVAVSLGTQTWAQVAEALGENLASFEDHDPFVARWAQKAAAGPSGQPDPAGPSRALVERIVVAAGKTLKVSSAGDLSDTAAVFGGGSQKNTARAMLEQGQGSRSWVIYRALRELGVKADIAVAEAEPFSASPDFPAHVGRFRHPLVIAHLGAAGAPAGGAPPGGKADGGDLWIDADVDGPPLPPGRISPELRGRAAMLPSGAIVTVEGASGETGDEIDVRLSLDARGDARGSFTILLHGRAAQGLADAFETVVGTDRREMLRSVVLGWLPWADVDDVTLSSLEGSWEVALRASIAVHGYGRPEGKGGKSWVLAGLEPVHVTFPRGFVGTLGATYASRGARQNALSIDTPMQYHLHRRIELPPGATVVRAPRNVKVGDVHLQAERRATAAPGALEEDFTLSLPTGTVSAGDYEAFVAEVHAVDDGFMAGTHLVVKP